MEKVTEGSLKPVASDEEEEVSAAVEKGFDFRYSPDISSISTGIGRLASTKAAESSPPSGLAFIFVTLRARGYSRVMSVPC